MNFFSITNIAFSWHSYDMSWLELFGTLLGAWAVWLTTRQKILSWPIGIANIVLFALLFYQLQLYSDTLLQGYYLVMSIYGWYVWQLGNVPISQSANEAAELQAPNPKPQTLSVSALATQQRIILLAAIVVATALSGFCMLHIHEWLPALFAKPASFPFADSAVMVMSIAAQALQTRKKVECWWLWLAVNALAAPLYIQKGALLLTIEYVAFFALALYGLQKWRTAQN